MKKPVCRWRVCLPALIACMMKAGHVMAGQGYVMAGIGGGPDALDSWQGVLYTPLGSLSQSGPVVRVFNKAYRFSYKTTLPPGVRATVSATGFSVEAEAGWQFADKELGRVGLFAGIVWRDHILKPNDPGSNLDRARFGFSAGFDGETRFGDEFGVMANASYVTGFEQYWAQARPYVDLGNGWKAGPEIAVFGGKGYDIGRAGVFTTGYEVNLGSWGRVFLGGEAGVRFSLRAVGKNIAPYGGVNIGYLF